MSSNNQGPIGIDWPAVAAYLLSLDPNAGVIVKVNQGLGYVNPDLHAQRQGAHAAGILNVGLYDYLTPSANSGHDEATAFLAAIGADGGILKGEFLAGDEEDPNVAPDADLDAFTLDWAQTVQRPLGIAPFLYSGSYYLTPHNLNRDPALAAFPLWLAQYQATMPPCPPPWKKISMWQYSSTAQVPGIQGYVDINWFEGTIDDLRPYQWGFAIDPLAGQLVAGKPDIPVNSSGEAIDVTAAAVAIARNIAIARGWTSRNTAQDIVLATTQGDAAAIALVGGMVT